MSSYLLTSRMSFVLSFIVCLMAGSWLYIASKCTESIASISQAQTFIWTNFNTLYPRMFCAKFGYRSGYGANNFKMFSMYFYILQFQSVWKNVTFYKKEIQSPSPRIKIGDRISYPGRTKLIPRLNQYLDIYWNTYFSAWVSYTFVTYHLIFCYIV